MAFGDLKGTLNGGGASITSSNSITGSVSVSAGDLIVLIFAEQNDLTVDTVTDNLGHTLTAQSAGTDATNVTSRAYWLIATAAGTLTTITAAATASTDDWAGAAGVFEGPFAASPLDASPADTIDNTSPFTCPATGTLAQADELIIAGLTITRGQTDVAATSPNLLALTKTSGADNAASSCGASLGRQVVSSTSSVSPAFTFTSGTVSGGVQQTMSFKKALPEELPPGTVMPPLRPN